MKLTKAERLILFNQFRLLESLYPEEARDCQNACEILQSGYALEYDSLVSFGEETPEETAREVIEILNMYRALSNASIQLPEGSFDPKDAIFNGFDGNEEGEHYSYASFMIEKQGRWAEFKTAELNSHWPMLDEYRAMLARWELCREKLHLTAEDVSRILGASHKG